MDLLCHKVLDNLKFSKKQLIDEQEKYSKE